MEYSLAGADNGSEIKQLQEVQINLKWLQIGGFGWRIKFWKKWIKTSIIQVITWEEKPIYRFWRKKVICKKWMILFSADRTTNPIIVLQIKAFTAKGRKKSNKRCQVSGFRNGDSGARYRVEGSDSRHSAHGERHTVYGSANLKGEIRTLEWKGLNIKWIE